MFDIDKMDPACIDLCTALNELIGIETIGSCCGHGKSPYLIWFNMDAGLIGATILSRCMSGRYCCYAEGELRADPIWRVYLGDTECLPLFVLEGKPMNDDEEIYAPAEKLAENIRLYNTGDRSEQMRQLFLKEIRCCSR